ncbi:MAG: ArsR/SmtB family transcription factor [Microbacteriaceae bacterium]
MPTDELPSVPVNEHPQRIIDLEGLKALAHPLRVKIVDTLSTYGSFTASGLAERLGESSGAMSYHLRQLEKHNFVREVEEKGTGRERWWDRVPGGISVNVAKPDSSPSERAASRMVLREWMSNRAVVFDDFLDRGEVVLDTDWLDASIVSTSNLQLTREQTLDYSTRLMEVVDEFTARYRSQRVAGSRPVQTHINVFPVLDGNPITQEKSE